jgi:serine/threonine protein kinase/outer membrane biosynthesis protein TonB
MANFNPKPFGKYFLIDKLATGGMAEIYKAKTFGVDGFEKLLAIKRILPHCSEDKEFITMLIDEAKLSVLLSHTNIVQVYDLGKVGDDYFISMEFIGGYNLREVLNRLADAGEKLDEELAVYIISEVCKGLDYAHSKKNADGVDLNIIHRDVSPQNILISYEGEVKIVDFGIAKAAMNVSQTMAGILKGKISYMSPEQALGKPIDRKTDIFSAGLMLYELLTGEKMFTGDTQFEVLKKIRTSRLTEKSFPEGISPPIKAILAKALTYSTKDRYDNAGDFQIDLTRYLYTTYADFTPRKLAKLMNQLFAKEIKNKQEKEQKETTKDSNTQSIMVKPEEQEDIVHRESTAEHTGPSFAQSRQGTQTFIESFVTGREDPEVTPEPDVTQARQPLVQVEIEKEIEEEEEEEEEEVTPRPSPEPTLVSVPTVPKVKVKAPRKKRKLGVFIYPLAAALLIGAGLWGYFKTDWFQAPPPPPKGILQINSTPPGARIFVNDSETVLNTPATLDTLEVGQAQKITLRIPKYKEWTQTVTLADPNPVSLNPTLEVIPVGSLKIATTPPGAKIFLDGQDTNLVSPTTLEELPLSKTYTLKLALEKYRPVEEKITIYSIEPMEFSKNLEEIQYGSVRISSVPSGAKVFINNNDSGQATPALIQNLEVGSRFNLRLSHPGYQDANRSVEIAKPEQLAVAERMVKIPEKPEIQTPPIQETAKTVPPKEIAPKQQETKTETVKEAKKETEPVKETKTEPVKETKKETEVVKETKTETPPAEGTVGYIALSSKPAGANVFINGVRQGTAPGKFKVKTGGPVEVTVTKSGLSTVTKVVTVKPGETRNLGTIALAGRSTGGGTGVVVIDSNPSGAMVLLNGRPQQSTPARISGLTMGENYTFTVQKDGYKTWSQSVTVDEGSKSFMAVLKKK